MKRFLLGLFVVLLITAGCMKYARSTRYVLPNGYIGWIRIDHGVKDASPLPLEHGFFLAVIPESGILKTSTDLPEGWSKPEWYYDTGNGRIQIGQGHSKIWILGEGTGNAGSLPDVPVFHHIFIGTREQFLLITKESYAMDRTALPKPGNLAGRFGDAPNKSLQRTSASQPPLNSKRYAASS